MRLMLDQLMIHSQEAMEWPTNDQTFAFKKSTSNGEALEWVGDLVSIAEELLVEFEHPKIESIMLKVRHPERYWLASWLAVPWFVRQMNSMGNGYIYTAEVVA